MPIAQRSNDQMYGVLDSKFGKTADPETLSRQAYSKYLALPDLRGFWGGAIRNDTAYAGTPYLTDQSWNGYHFPPQVSAGVFYGAFLHIPYVEFDGNRYYSQADNNQWDITGLEAWQAHKGISMGCWFQPQRAYPYGTDEGLITKWNTVGNARSYKLEINTGNANRITFQISTDGITNYAFDHTKTLAQNTWYFTAATWNPGAVLNEAAGCRIWVNDDMQYHNASDRGTAGFPAQIFNSATAFRLCDYMALAKFLGFATYWWICGCYLSEGHIFGLYEATKHLWGYANNKGTAW